MEMHHLVMLAIMVPILVILYLQDAKTDTSFTPGACLRDVGRFFWLLVRLMLLVSSLLTLSAFSLAWLVAVFDGSSGAALNAATGSLLAAVLGAYVALCVYHHRFVFIQDSPEEKKRKEIERIDRMPRHQIQIELDRLKQSRLP